MPHAAKRTFSSAFLADDPRAAAFLRGSFRDPEARLRAVRAAAARTIAPALLDELRHQDALLPPSADRADSLDALARPGTAVVVTGQQLGLFLGPLYTLYKALSAAQVARALERESGVRCVPVFWLQAEDHDFAEIDHCHVLGSSGAAITLQLGDGGQPARRSCGERTLGGDADVCVDQLAESLAKLPHAEETVALLRRHYRPGQDLAAAFAGLLADLCGGDGLLFLNPRTEAVARLAAPIHRRAIGEHERLATALAARTAELAAAGFAEQVHVRERSSLSFFHEPGTGDRYRLARRGDAWTLPGSAREDAAISDEELAAALIETPLRFSTSALLRPILQDSLLPTAAYVGGPGELSYFAQLPPLYAAFDLPVPLFVPRARLRVTDGKSRSRLARLGLAPSDLERPRDDLLRRLTPAGHGLLSPERLESELLQGFRAGLDRFAAFAPSLDSKLGSAASRTRATVERAASRLASRYRRALFEKDRALGERLDRLLTALQPGGVPQERHYGFASFAAQVGPHAFVDRVRASIQAFDLTVRDLDL